MELNLPFPDHALNSQATFELHPPKLNLAVRIAKRVPYFPTYLCMPYLSVVDLPASTSQVLVTSFRVSGAGGAGELVNGDYVQFDTFNERPRYRLHLWLSGEVPDIGGLLVRVLMMMKLTDGICTKTPSFWRPSLVTSISRLPFCPSPLST